MADLDEELGKATEEEQRRQEFEETQQLDKRRRAARMQKIARFGERAARMAGQEDLADVLGDAEGGDAGATRQAASNKAGRQASKLAQSKFQATKGQGAAIGGAVSGALEGEGAIGIAESAISWWVLDLVFASLFTIIGFIPALLYLDFHFILHKLGSKLFGAMSLWQKLLLLTANLIAALIPLAFILLVYSATCGNSLVSTFSKVLHYGTATAVDDFCGAFQGGTSGGGGASGTFSWEPSDLVALSGVPVDSGTSDPRVRQCMLGKVQQIIGAAQAAGLTVTITSAFRSGDFPSRHAYGEAVDIAIRPLPSQPWRTNPQIAKLVQIARAAGFSPPAGDTIDEYNNPVERTSGGHVHVEFNKISADASFCAPYSNPPAPFT